MSTSLRVVKTPAGWHRWGGDGIDVGDMWRVPTKDQPDRECWAILLPNGAGVWLTIEEAGGTDQQGWGPWSVTGTPPNITVSPSIDAGGLWHGTITNGEMSP